MARKIISDDGLGNDSQAPYFFNTYLKVYTVLKSTNEKYTYLGGIYND